MEELANTLTHGIGLLLVLVAVPFLIILAATRATVWHVVAVSIYGASLITLYAASTIYHWVRHAPAKRILRTIDHSAIYLLIAGTYTPFMLVNLRGGWGWTLLALSGPSLCSELPGSCSARNTTWSFRPSSISPWDGWW